MTKFLVRRLIQSFFLVIGITIITFGIMQAAPGGPFQFYDDPRLRRETVNQIAEAYGLNDPIPVQYFKWVRGIARLDFGRSFVDNRPVVDKIAERIPATFQLSLASYLLGLLGIPLGVYAAVHRGGALDNAVRVFTVIGNAVPHWWLGLMILVISANTINLFPLGGQYTIGKGDLLDRLVHLALPSMIGALGGWIVFSRFVRSGVLDTLGQDYIRTARAKGLTSSVVLNRHALRNALIPVVTLLGGTLATLFSGGVLFETTFSWPGLGRLAVQAAFARDYPTVMALTLIFSVLVILGNLMADIAYGFVDPRVRYD